MPPFTEEFVIPTIQQLLADRPQFLAEKVDGIFQALSQNHVTNSPWAFGKRMIIEHVFDPQWGSLDYRQGGHIHDLRNVVARIMGRGTLPYQNTSFVLGLVRRKHGEWFDIDGGSLRFRAYKKGTCHIEIHEDMAWRLNAILAILHPRAIPEENRRPRRSPKRRKKDVNLFSDVLPFEVLTVIQDIRERGASKDLRTYYFPYSWRQLDKHVKQAVLNALYAIGGVREEDRFIRFGYDADTVLEAVISTGRLPNKKSYQWYPTPPKWLLRP